MKGIQGSGATLNNPNTKRGLNNTVTIKTGLEVRQMTDHTNPTPTIQPRGDTPENIRES